MKNKQAFTLSRHAEPALLPLRAALKGCYSGSNKTISASSRYQNNKTLKQVQGDDRKGFTLIELLVVVLIIGVLAAVAVPQYQKAVDKSKYQTIIAVMRSIVKAENLYKLEHGDYTQNWVELASTGIDIAHTEISENKRAIFLKKSEAYDLGADGSYPYVMFGDNFVGIYAALPVELWICYPRGNTRGKAICKHLGCAANKLDEQFCYFKPN